MLKDIAKSDSSWKIICLRYFNPVGAHDSGLIGEDPNGTPNNLFPYIGQVAIGKLPYLNIYGNDYPTQDGTGIRDYIHVMDLVDGHLAAINFLSRRGGWNVFNLGTGRGVSVLEIVHAFEWASQVKVPFKITLRRSGDIASCFASADLDKLQLRWKAERNLEEMCASAWLWQQQ
jgi:UDP-glucose 4-epimerase